VLYIIERRRKFLWFQSWYIDLRVDVYQTGPIGVSTINGAKKKLDEIISSNGIMMNREVILEN
jgi:hypothetical protein